MKPSERVNIGSPPLTKEQHQKIQNAADDPEERTDRRSPVPEKRATAGEGPKAERENAGLAGGNR